jgi:hypothetical protein
MLTLREILKPGITGTVRWPRGEVKPIGDEEIRAFRAGCHAAARRLNAAVTRERPAEYSTNYHALEITPRYGDAAVEVLLHLVLPYVGARPVGPEQKVPIFVDVPWSDAEVAAGLVVLPAPLLNAAITPEPWMRDVLDPKAWEDLHYWKPKCVGEFVFNFYE